MGEQTAIEWCHHSFNPWWGCTKVSEACRNCYAEAWARRTGHGDTWGATGRRRFFGNEHWAAPLKWDRAAEKAGERRRVFCASMADVFEMLPVDHPDREAMTEARTRLGSMICATPNLDWLLLTKRPENIAAATWRPHLRSTWPSNVWIGTTAEDQATAEQRIPHLLKTPAAVRFLSCEPLLESINFDRVIWETCGDCDPCIYGVGRTQCYQRYPINALGDGGIDWVIVGGESGPRARSFDCDAARAIVRQCRAAGVACFVKQLGALPRIDGWLAGHGPIAKLRDRKGGDMAEWPEDVRVREVPSVR